MYRISQCPGPTARIGVFSKEVEGDEPGTQFLGSTRSAGRTLGRWIPSLKLEGPACVTPLKMVRMSRRAHLLKLVFTSLFSSIGLQNLGRAQVPSHRERLAGLAYTNTERLARLKQSDECRGVCQLADSYCGYRSK